MFASKYIYNIRFMLFVRTVFGFYYDFDIAAAYRFLVKICCILSAVFQLAVVLCSPCSPHIYGGKVIYFRVIEFLTYIAVSLWTNDLYLKKYLERDSSIDLGLYQNAIYKRSQNIVNAYIPILIIYYFILFFFHFVHIWDCGNVFHFVLLTTMHFSIGIGRTSVFIIFTAFYCRIRIYQKNVYRGLSEGRFLNVDKYKLIYLDLQENLKETLPAVRIMMAIHLVSVFLDSLVVQYAMVYDFVVSDVKLFPTISTCTQTLYSYIAVSYPAIIIDLCNGILGASKIRLANRLVTSTDRKQSERIRDLLRLLHSRPLEFTIWRVVPLNMSLPVGFVMLVANYLVCLLQFTHFQPK